MAAEQLYLLATSIIICTCSLYEQVVNGIWHKAASPSHTDGLVQSYSPGCANVHPHLTHGSFGPPQSTSQTASRSVQSCLQGSRSWQTDRPRYSVC